MNIPKDLKYTKDHEWAQQGPDGTVRIGLTDYAQSELGDLVFVNLPQVGDALAVGGSLADVESVKAVSDVFSPVAGVVSAVNEALLDNPGAINADCYGAWLAEVKDVTAWDDGIMDAAAYGALLAGEG